MSASRAPSRAARPVRPAKAITLVEAPRKKSSCEQEMRYDVLLHGKQYSELYFNLRGYLGSLPTPDNLPLDIGEKSISAYRKQIALLNQEWAAASAAQRSADAVPTLAGVRQRIAEAVGGVQHARESNGSPARTLDRVDRS
ncbi:hypothetical protein [Deinococcus ruber]|uniref:Uncharacterized protein n=1 Tax=Deinococcus ruber TaxID=1848197 RepID=A0A918FHN6_9DEIO|nr:hypothetical protein [Deinococcus ruber]GGR37939.1 hypothetical protein GCM10008957_54050 [Deinococcus ruber]